MGVVVRSFVRLFVRLFVCLFVRSFFSVSGHADVSLTRTTLAKAAVSLTEDRDYVPTAL